MTGFDDRLKQALDADDEAFLRELDRERGLFAQIGDTMNGPLGGWARLVAVASVVLAIWMAVTIWQMIVADDQRALILWTAAALAAFIAQGMVKQWFFERMNLIAILRELKRIELRVARIEDKG